MPLEHFAETRGWKGGGALLGEVEVRRVDQPRERGSGRLINRGIVYRDGIRLNWRDEVQFDMFDGKRIDYIPGADWRSALPTSFYSTVAALTVAWLGALPVHACAVEIDGRAFVIAGRAGAGKSTLAAALIAKGASLVADDLTVIRAIRGSGIAVFAGRPAMRQHPGTAASMASECCTRIEGDASGKWLVRPTARTRKISLPLGGILIFQNESESTDSAGKLKLLARNLFRPKWLSALPNYAVLRRDLLTLSSEVPVRTLPEVVGFDLVMHARRAEEAVDLLQQMRTG